MKAENVVVLKRKLHKNNNNGVEIDFRNTVRKNVRKYKFINS